jgi:hypothetical protein
VSLRIKGLVHIAVEAHDMPALPIQDTWAGLGVTPAVVSWNLQAADGIVFVPRQTVVDFRQTEPRNESFWKTYAAGTHQNKYGFRYPWRATLVGRYSYNLTPPSGLDTRNLPTGTYILTVGVADTAGNNGSLGMRITVTNSKVAPGRSNWSAWGFRPSLLKQSFSASWARETGFGSAL